MTPHRPGLSSSVAIVAAAALCLVLSPPAMAGDPLTSIKVNEVESEGPADFIELANASATATDVSGLVLKDDDDARTLAIPAGTSVPANGFLAVDTDGPGGFGMSSSDAARVFMPDGVTQIDGYSWTAHAATSFGRCPDGTGAFVTTGAVTKGAANACPPPLQSQPWPGSASVTTVDQAGVLGADVSGLDYEGSGSASPGVMWAVDNGNSLMLRLVWDGTQWVSDTADGWSTGKTLRYPDGVLSLDAEGVTLTDAGAAGGVYVASERTNRMAVLRYDVSGNAATLTATGEWNLTPDLPALPVNRGPESVEWVPDSYLVGSGFVDQTTGAPYDPAAYANHGSGLFFVGVEDNGIVYAYALDQTSGSFTRVATFASGFPTFGALHWESAMDQLWVVCDNNCNGRSRVFQVDTQAGATRGSFVAVADYERPTGMANLNNEGFTIPPAGECVGGSKPVFWADDGNANGHVLRAGTLTCTVPVTPQPQPPTTPTVTPFVTPDPTVTLIPGPAATATQSPTPGPPRIDVTRPVLSRVRGSRASVSFTISEAANVRITIERLSGKRYKRVKAFTVAAAAGAKTVRFKGRVPAAGLRRGRLRITLVATDRAGNRSAAMRKRVPSSRTRSRGGARAARR